MNDPGFGEVRDGILVVKEEDAGREGACLWKTMPIFISSRHIIAFMLNHHLKREKAHCQEGKKVHNHKATKVMRALSNQASHTQDPMRVTRPLGGFKCTQEAVRSSQEPGTIT